MKKLSAMLLISSVTFVGCEPANDEVATAPPDSVKPDTAPAGAAEETAETKAAAFYFVDHYDAKRDPAQDLAQAVEKAKSENKRVLVQVGGDWCGWCKLMSKYMETNDAVNQHLTKNFLVMKVTYEDGQKNEAFLSQYPAITGYPHLFVIDNDGKLLHSQETGSLEEGKGYNQEKFLAFLDAWKPQ